MSKIKDPKSVLRGLASALLGVIAYCAVVAPVFKEGSYWESAKENFSAIGVGFSAAIVLVGVLWLVIIHFANKSQ
ncbi:hypothetical protein LJU02_08470 [Corynebacterium pseudotuberculosis]|uniref:Secreted protein n=1 Tax=Corynebacterium pseudotuberculosis 258 TaxID=1168865 RepID=A0AAU8RPL6_CORPS|nr:hypothetical protein [Corynebacterium pseudotuberculosis]AEQ07196.1 hypothetical protein CPCIP5297_08590 [Corynebacterium pseudotuberculosis CIP 52.97]AJF93893.1 hypothetical protein CP258_08590 [Corynebacterium pseudotuberculosis 258]AKN59740.1 hypothetical protein CP31_08795 [Corynebacterium pseudotuberculosis 31]AKS14013.1 Hypothetical protein CpE19_1675 [Corynebacterium pseudotuberculosis]AMN70535.1 hypothetical protein ATN02_08875 [Corynebacterium pseudotuberculosis]